MATSEFHRSREALESDYSAMERSPQTAGTIKLIVIRPGVDRRIVIDEGELDVDVGLVGDNWHDRVGHQVAEPSAKESQITLMNSRIAELLSPERSRWPLAGDQLFVDLDLSKENLAPGQRLRIGSAQLEISEMPHLGCKKFMARFGLDALAFISTEIGKFERMRGVYARVTKSGFVRVGDTVEKIAS